MQTANFETSSRGVHATRTAMDEILPEPTLTSRIAFKVEWRFLLPAHFLSVEEMLISIGGWKTIRKCIHSNRYRALAQFYILDVAGEWCRRWQKWRVWRANRRRLSDTLNNMRIWMNRDKATRSRFWMCVNNIYIYSFASRCAQMLFSRTNKYTWQVAANLWRA